MDPRPTRAALRRRYRRVAPAPVRRADHDARTTNGEPQAVRYSDVGLVLLNLVRARTHSRGGDQRCDHIPAGVSVEDDRDPAATAGVGRPEEARRLGVDDRSLGARRRRKVD